MVSANKVFGMSCLLVVRVHLFAYQYEHSYFIETITFSPVLCGILLRISSLIMYQRVTVLNIDIIQTHCMKVIFTASVVVCPYANIGLSYVFCTRQLKVYKSS